MADGTNQLEPRDPYSVDFGHLARLLWSGRNTIITTAGIAFILAVIYLHTQTFVYTSTVTLAATQPQSQGIASQFGSLASLAGINLSQSQGVTPFTIYADTLQTEDVANDLIAHAPAVMPRLFRYEWDDRTNSWREPRSLVHMVAQVVKPILGMPITFWSPPGAAELRAYIIGNIKVSPDPKRPVLTLAYKNPDPVFANEFLAMVHDSTDRVLRRMTVERSSKYAKYLEDRLPSVQTSDLRLALIQSLSQQETLIMMGSSDTSFAAQPLGAPITSLRPTEPRGWLVLFGSMIVGLAAGAFATVQKIPILVYLQKIIATAQRRTFSIARRLGTDRKARRKLRP